MDKKLLFEEKEDDKVLLVEYSGFEDLTQARPTRKAHLQKIRVSTSTG